MPSVARVLLPHRRYDHTSHRACRRATIPSLLVVLPALSAQTPVVNSDVTTLSPFEVNSSKDVAAQVSIMTPEFLQDVAAGTSRATSRRSRAIS